MAGASPRMDPEAKAQGEHLLREAYGPSARFRDGQWDAIQAILAPGARQLVVQRTGWGKSIVYFLATRLLRDAGCGPTLLISPLLALMRNQKDIAQRFRVRAESINSTNVEDWERVEDSILDGSTDLVLVSPERLSNPQYVERVLPALEKHAGMLVIDEAHCISDWGHDFRPDYRRILQVVRRLSPEARVLGTTATANDRVIADISLQFDGWIEVQRGPLMRDSLALEVHLLADQAERYAWLTTHLPHLEGNGIIYTLTVNDANRLAQWLRLDGHDVEPYHSLLTSDKREQLEASFQSNRLKALVATTALGMGYDKPDIGFVVHFQRPGSVIHYYQQIGRAGRSLEYARVVLLVGYEDDEIIDYFIRQAFPGPRCFEEVLEALAEPRSGIPAITARTNHRQSQVEKTLKLLSVEGVVTHDRSGWRRMRDDWRPDELRAEQITAQRRRELAEMQEFTSHRGCRMQFLARALDDCGARTCGRCDRCSPRDSLPLARKTVVSAISFLRRGHPEIAIKKQFPAGIKAEGRKTIPGEERLLSGRSLSVYGDAGWGRLVREGKYQHEHFSDDLVEASVEVVRSLPVQPEWVAWVPSLRRPGLVPDFARRLAASLGMPAHGVVEKVADNPEQKTQENSTRQFQNVWKAFRVDGDTVLPSPCLLVDDIVDSGWTLTALGILLRRAGCSAVIPFTLAIARAKE